MKNAIVYTMPGVSPDVCIVAVMPLSLRTSSDDAPGTGAKLGRKKGCAMSCDAAVCACGPVDADACNVVESGATDAASGPSAPCEQLTHTATATTMSVMMLPRDM